MKGLKEKRLQSKMTLEEVGKRIGVSFRTIFNYEAGKRKPDIEKLQKLAKLFECSIEELL